MQPERPSDLNLRALLSVATFAAAALGISGCGGSAAPAQPVNGGGYPGKPTPTPIASPTGAASPTAAPVSGAEAACVLTIGATTYAFVPGAIATGTDAGTVGLAEVTLSSGAGIASRGRVAAAGHIYAPNKEQVHPRGALRSATSSSHLRTLDAGAGGSPILALTPAPQECAADVAHSDLYLINYGSAVINVVHVDPTTAAMSLVTTYTSDATGSIGFSGGEATIVGEAWDSHDGGLIIATPTTYELYSGARAATSPNTKVRTIATINPSENFGYNSATNQIWSPSYLTSSSGSLDSPLIDVASGNVYNQSPLPSGISEPDQGAVDSSTNVAVSVEEFAYTMYLVPLSQNVLGSGTFTNPNAVTVNLTTSQENGCCPISDISIDSTSHLMFTDVEFGTGVGVVTLPSTGTGTPAVGDYVFAALPSGGPSELPGDPHAVATFNLPASGPYGLTFDIDYHTVVVVDMRKALAATRSGSDPHGTTLTTGTNIYYITI